MVACGWGRNASLCGTAPRARSEREIEASLKRLGTDWIDHYQLHWPDPDTAFEDSLGVMGELVQAGKIRSVGICNFAGDQVRRAHAAYPQLATLQSPYSMLRRDLETDTFHFCAHRGIEVLPYWPLEQGVLTGRYTPATPPANASRQVLAQIEVVETPARGEDPRAVPVSYRPVMAALAAGRGCGDSRRVPGRATRGELRNCRLELER